MFQRTLKISGVRVAIGLLCIAPIATASAQTIADHSLAGATVIESGACSVLRIEFYGRVQLHSHFPAANGDELKISLKALDRTAPALPTTPGGAGAAKKTETSVGPRREQARAPASERAAINAIELENAGIDQTLSIYFRHAVSFRVAAGKDPRTVLVAIAGRTANTTCAPELADQNSAPVGVPQSAASGNGALDSDMAEARAAMAKADHDKAIAHLTRVTEAGPTKLLAEALELLGLAREQKGHLAHARADYQSYLKQFPQGDGHARVQQRLATLDKRQQQPVQPAGIAVLPTTPATKLEGKPYAGAADAAKYPAVGDGSKPDTPQPNVWTVQHSGSLSSFYNLNQGGRDYFSRPKQNAGWEKENIYQTYRNSSLSQADYEGSASNAFYYTRIQISGSQEHRFTDNANELRLSSLSFEGKLKESGSSLRFGRQTYYGGGVLGRFDGGLVTVPFGDAWKFRTYGGSPVERSYDRPFLFDRSFYGASLDYAVTKRLDVGVFVIEQKSDKFVDRRAVGGEARFVDETKHGFGSVDYDVHFGEINSAMATGTLNFADKSSLTGTLDYRRSPMMFTSNALQGQSERTLKDLLRRYNIHEIEDLARDRTPKSTVASIAYTRFLHENLQATAELTVTNMSSMPDSGGVAWTPSTGWDTYSMLQLMATDVFKTNDSVTGSVRYATTQAANRSLLEGSVRLPMTDPNWRVGPMLRVGYSDYKLEPVKEYIIHPMLRTSYNITQNLLFEFEVGHRWTFKDTPRGRENETDMLLLSGLRYDFHTSR
jgi:tetratricopeptide (TPR) repeat protein